MQMKLVSVPTVLICKEQETIDSVQFQLGGLTFRKLSDLQDPIGPFFFLSLALLPSFMYYAHDLLCTSLPALNAH